MNRKLFYVILTALLALLLSVGGATGQEPAGKAEPQGEVTIAAVVNSRISYQGVLKEGGNPVTGSRDMIFRLYSDDTCTTQVGADIPKTGVSVAAGLFSVELDVAHSDFNGQGLWLEVEVGGTQIGCREILPVPYALSLRPGAQVNANNTSYGLSVENTGTGDGIRAYAGAGNAVLGSSTSGYAGYFTGTGDVAQTRTGDGLVKAAVYAYCGNTGSTITRSFNHAGGTTTIVNGLGAGRCTIDFGFDISDRFWSATTTTIAPARAVTCQQGGNNDELDCFRFDTTTGGGLNWDIMVLVY